MSEELVNRVADLERHLERLRLEIGELDQQVAIMRNLVERVITIEELILNQLKRKR